jgi:hypothetical protein
MIIGQIVGGKKLELDLPTLVDTRLLIQANSGGGKSWLLRLIAERAGIQTIVLDNEGEFASLREAVDVLLVGAGGELTADPRHAALLARRLLEYKVSAVVDLYELKLPDRRRFLKLLWNRWVTCHATFGGPHWSFSTRRIFIAPSAARGTRNRPRRSSV